MGFFFEGYNVITVLTLAILIAVVMAGNEITRRSKTLSIIAYMVVPVIIFILCVPLQILGTPSGQTWFGWELRFLKRNRKRCYHNGRRLTVYR